MSDIAAIEARLQTALDRIAEGVEAVSAGDSGAEAEVARLRAALDAETAKTNELTDRVAAIQEKQDQTVTALNKQVGELGQQVGQQKDEIQRLMQVNAALRASARSIRQAFADGPVDGAEVNRVMEAELEATRAAQEADRAELDAILAELTPLIEEKPDV